MDGLSDLSRRVTVLEKVMFSIIDSLHSHLNTPEA